MCSLRFENSFLSSYCVRFASKIICLLYSSYVALFYIERDCLSKTEIGEREIDMHFKCM